jgi:hypothetical protein
VAKGERSQAELLDRLIDDPAAGAAGSEDLRPLVALAADLRRSLSPALAGEAQRERLLARLARRAAHQQPSPRLRWPLRLRPAYALASLLLVLAFAFGTTAAYASEAALPGDPLYPVKRGLEEARLALSTTSAGDSQLIMVFADRRMSEIESLTGLGRWSDVDRALEEYPTVVDELVALSQADDESSQATRLSRHLEVLTRVQAKVPPAAEPALERALERAGRGRQEAERRGDEPKPVHDPPGQEKKDEARERGPKTTPPGQERKDQGGG